LHKQNLSTGHVQPADLCATCRGKVYVSSSNENGGGGVRRG
jgi:hypothetical protein